MQKTVCRGLNIILIKNEPGIRGFNARPFSLFYHIEELRKIYAGLYVSDYFNRIFKQNGSLQSCSTDKIHPNNNLMHRISQSVSRLELDNFLNCLQDSF